MIDSSRTKPAPPPRSPIWHSSRFAARLWFSLLIIVTMALAVSLSSSSQMAYLLRQNMASFHFSNSFFTSARPSDGQRIALCFTGNSRTFYYPLVHDKIFENIVTPLRQSYPTDVFFNIKIDDDPRPSRPRAESRHNETLKAIDKFSPVAVRLLNSSHSFSSKRADRTQRHIYRPANCSSHDRWANLPHSLFRSQQCISLISDYEEKHGFKYKWVYRSRPDVVMFDPIMTPESMTDGTVYANRGPEQYIWHFVRWWKSAFNSSTHIPPFTDHILAGFRDNMMVALDAFEAINNCTFYSMRGEKNSESALGFWTLSHGLEIRIGPGVWAVVRAEKGAECRRIRKMSIRDRKKRVDMDQRCRTYNDILHTVYPEISAKGGTSTSGTSASFEVVQNASSEGVVQNSSSEVAI